MVNLLQVSSAFGRAMEAIDRTAMSQTMLPALISLKQSGRLNEGELAAAIAATAEGYPFPTNLDTDPPIGGNAPVSQAELLEEAVVKGQSEQEFSDVLSALKTRQKA